MHLDPYTGLWKPDDNDYVPEKATEELLDIPDSPEHDALAAPPPVLNGSCTLSVRFENEEEYNRWKKLSGGRQWEFLVSYPAIMRAEYPFHDSLEAEIMAKKIVQLLQWGFNVYSANWTLEEKKG